jgi:hypothetical protein
MVPSAHERDHMGDDGKGESLARRIATRWPLWWPRLVVVIAAAASITLTFGVVVLGFTANEHMLRAALGRHRADRLAMAALFVLPALLAIAVGRWLRRSPPGARWPRAAVALTLLQLLLTSLCLPLLPTARLVRPGQLPLLAGMLVTGSSLVVLAVGSALHEREAPHVLLRALVAGCWCYALMLGLGLPPLVRASMAHVGHLRNARLTADAAALAPVALVLGVVVTLLPRMPQALPRGLAALGIAVGVATMPDRSAGWMAYSRMGAPLLLSLWLAQLGSLVLAGAHWANLRHQRRRFEASEGKVAGVVAGPPSRVVGWFDDHGPLRGGNAHHDAFELVTEHDTLRIHAGHGLLHVPPPSAWSELRDGQVPALRGGDQVKVVGLRAARGTPFRTSARQRAADAALVAPVATPRRLGERLVWAIWRPSLAQLEISICVLFPPLFTVVARAF